MKTKNKNLVYLVLIFALILAFCGALLLSVFVGEKVAFAQNLPSDITGTYTQLVNLDPYPSADDFVLANCSTSIINGQLFFIPDSNLSYSNPCSIVFSDTSTPLIPGHRYLFMYLLYIPTFSGSFSFNVEYPSGLSYAITYSSGTYRLYDPKYFTHTNDSYAHSYVYFKFSCYSNVSFSISNIQLVDLSLLQNFQESSGISSIWTQLGYGYHPYTGDDGIPYSLLSSSYNEPSSLSYNRGFADGTSSLGGFSFTTSVDNFVPSPGYPLFEQVIGDYWSIYGITDDEAYISLNVGWRDLFHVDFDTLRDSSFGFSWNLGTASKQGNILNYGSTTYRSKYYGFEPDLQYLILSDSSNPSDPYDDYNIFMEVQEHHILIHSSFFTSDTLNSGFVPNFNPSMSPELYNLQFFFDNNVSFSYKSGYTQGYQAATNTIIDTSASWSAGYNAGVSSAQNTTFDSLMSAVIDVPIRTIGGLLDFNFLGINLLQFIYSLLTLGIIIAIIRLCLGKS